MDSYTLEDYDSDLYNFNINTKSESDLTHELIEERDYNSHKFMMPKETNK